LTEKQDLPQEQEREQDRQLAALKRGEEQSKRPKLWKTTKKQVMRSNTLLRVFLRMEIEQLEVAMDALETVTEIVSANSVEIILKT